MVEGRRFKVAFSFSGEQRTRVSAIADKLSETLGRQRILYDGYHAAEFARPNLDTHLLRLYNEESELLVVVLSSDFEGKEWCQLEVRVIRDLLKRKQGNRLMFLRVDDASVSGLLSIDGYVDIRDLSTDEVARLICDRLTREGVHSTEIPSPESALSCEAWYVIIETWERLCHVPHWSWTDALLSADPSIRANVYVDLESLHRYFLGLLWPIECPSLQKAFRNFAAILTDWLEVFGQYALYSGDRVGTMKFYREAEPGPTYQQELEKFNFHSALVKDLTLELTRAANRCCDVIRQTIDPKYRREDGALVVQWIHLLDRRYVRRPEYDDEDAQYPGLREFLSAREQRDFHFGSGTDPESDANRTCEPSAEESKLSADLSIRALRGNLTGAAF